MGVAAEQMLAALNRDGVKLTSQRRAIVRAFASDPTHPTANEIYARLADAHPRMSFATVYNTLATLRAAGLCRELAVEVGPARFDPNPAEHDHTVCDVCGAVRDVSTTHRTAPTVPGFRVRAVELVLRGTCATCATRDASDDSSRQPP
jgi:Fe2+ or Zn2+ uptake regulation protein